eukprot:3141714-Rhodomonas_salina.1
MVLSHHFHVPGLDHVHAVVVFILRSKEVPVQVRVRVSEGARPAEDTKGEQHSGSDVSRVHVRNPLRWYPKAHLLSLAQAVLCRCASGLCHGLAAWHAWASAWECNALLDFSSSRQ